MERRDGAERTVRPAACFTQSQVTGCSSTTRARFVIGQIIGASNYDVGHLALGAPGGGVANLGVVGRSNKAGGCTGIPTPTGDFYAIDYVAHEMGHQFSGNHPFNGTQLNCSGGNRNASTSTEPGSGSSIMAYAGICLTDDLQAHSDPYFSQRSQQEISTYTSSNQNAINEVQTASLRHFGGGNEQQVATFGPGFAPTATIQPLTVAIGAVPSATQLGGAQEVGNTVTISTGAAGSTHTLQPGDVVTIAGVANAGYNGTFTVTSVPSTRSFTYTNPISGLPVSGGGTITLAAPGATETRHHGDDPHGGPARPLGRRHRADHGRRQRRLQQHAATITSVPTPRSFTYEAPTSGLPNSGGGTVTFFSPFKLRFNGQDSATIGGSGLLYTNAEPDLGDQRDPRLRRHRDGHRRSVHRLHRHVHRRVGRRRRSEPPVRRPELRRLLRVRRGDEPRRRERLVHADYNGNTLGPDRERDELHRGRDPGRAPADPAGRRDRDGRGLRRRHVQQHRLPGDLRRHAGADERPLHARGDEPVLRHDGLRRRDGQGRRRRQQGRPGSSLRPATRSRS